MVTPDISAAAPLIDQVFGSLAPERRIAYRVCGAVSADSDVPLAVLIGLKNLLIGGFSTGEVCRVAVAADRERKIRSRK